MLAGLITENPQISASIRHPKDDGPCLVELHSGRKHELVAVEGSGQAVLHTDKTGARN